jgi:hypothetical protein
MGLSAELIPIASALKTKREAGSIARNCRGVGRKYPVFASPQTLEDHIKIEMRD